MSRAFNLKLVELVRAQPTIWDRNCPDYRSYTKHSKVWKQIAAELGVTPEQATQKWAYLRGNYSRSLRNIRDGKQHKLNLSGAMDFLRPHIDLRDGRQLLKELPTVGAGGSEFDDSVDVEGPQDEIENGNGKTTCAFALDTGSKDLMVDSRNADAVFLLGLLPEMQRMSPAEKRLFKQQAFELSQEFLDGVG